MKQKEWGIYYHGVLSAIMDTNNEKEVSDTVQQLRLCSLEPVPSIDYREIIRADSQREGEKV